MPRAATGQVVKRKRANGVVYGLRFNALGRRQYVTLGSSEDGWTPAQAHDPLEQELVRVAADTWKPAVAPQAPAVESDPSFHEFATDWLNTWADGWRPKTVADYEWQLSYHLLPFFKDHRLSQITIAEVDRYRAHKVKQGKLSATSINKTITRLGQILEVAVEYGLIDRNAARGKRRRLKATRPAPVWLDSAEQIAALLDAAGDLDTHAQLHGGHDQKGGLVYRRALLATLTFGGLRIGELFELQWRDVDLASGWITVREGKTSAAARRIDLLPALRDELAAHKANAPSIDPQSLVFATAAGTGLKYANVYKRVLGKSIEGANERLAKAGSVPLPAGLSPHKLRHTFASILVALGVDVGAVMDQLGHENAAFTIKVYRHGMRRDQESRAALEALVGGVKRHRKGTSAVMEGLDADSERIAAAR